MKAKGLAQMTMSLHLSSKSRNHEIPQQLAIRASIRQATRGKKIINKLHKFSVSASYERLLRLEAYLAGTLINRRQQMVAYNIPSALIPKTNRLCTR